MVMAGTPMWEYEMIGNTTKQQTSRSQYQTSGSQYLQPPNQPWIIRPCFSMRMKYMSISLKPILVLGFILQHPKCILASNSSNLSLDYTFTVYSKTITPRVSLS